MPASLAYRVCESQWRAGIAGATGLDYAACIAALQLYLPRWQAQAGPGDPIHRITLDLLMDDLRTIEDALLLAWCEQAEAKRAGDTDE